MTTTQHLNQLKSAGLIRLAQTQPEVEYLFRHALVQDAAYESLLLADRKQFHGQIGGVLERLYPDRLDELAATLAHHFALAGDNLTALKYFTLAGDSDAATYANMEAGEHYTRALELARQSGADGEKLTYLFTRLGRVLELNSQFELALATYQDMEQLAQQQGDRSLELSALVHQSQLRCTPNALFNPAQGETLAERALTLAKVLNDREAEAKILRNLMHLYRHTGRIPQALESGRRSLALVRELGLHEQLAYTLNDIAGLYSELGPAMAAIAEASDLWRQLDNQPMLADSLAYACWLHSFAGDYDAAVAYSDESFRLSQATNNLWGQSYSRYMVGLVHWNRGELVRAVEVMQEAIRLGAEAGFVVPGVTTRCWLALLYGDLGAVEVGIEFAEKAATAAEAHWARDLGITLACLARLYLSNDDVSTAATIFQQADRAEPLNDHWAQLAMWLRGQLALAQGNANQALALAGQCITELRQFHNRIFFLPDALYLQAQALLALDQPAAARERLLEARAEAEAIGSKRMLWQILAALAQIETDPTEAESLRQRAQKIIEYIINHTPVELRASFLNLPQVREVMET